MRRIATVEMGIVKYFMDTCSRSVKSLAREYEGGLERRRKTQRQKDRQTGKPIDRQADRQTDRQTDRETKSGRQTEQTHKQQQQK